MIELLAGIALRARQSFAQNGTWPADAPAIENQVKRIVARWPSAPPVDIALLLQGNCTDAQIDSFLQRVTDAQQKGHDAYGLTTDQLQAMLQRVIAGLTYTNPADPRQEGDRRFEATVLASHLSILQAMNVPYPSPPALEKVEIDGILPRALLEITAGTGGDKIKQFKKYWDADLAMYGTSPRPIIIYGPQVSSPTAYQMIQEANTLAKNGQNIPVYVITNGGISTNDTSLPEELNKLGITIPIYGITSAGKWTNVTFPISNNHQQSPAPVPVDISYDDLLRILGMLP